MPEDQSMLAHMWTLCRAHVSAAVVKGLDFVAFKCPDCDMVFSDQAAVDRDKLKLTVLEKKSAIKAFDSKHFQTHHGQIWDPF